MGAENELPGSSVASAALLLQLTGLHTRRMAISTQVPPESCPPPESLSNHDLIKSPHTVL